MISKIKNAPRRAHLAIVPICAISYQFHQVNKIHHPLKFHDYQIYELKQLQQFQTQNTIRKEFLNLIGHNYRKEIFLPNNSKSLVCDTVMMISYGS